MLRLGHSRQTSKMSPSHGLLWRIMSCCMHFFDCCRQWTEFILQVKTKSPHARSSKVLWIQLRLGVISLTTRLPDQVKPPHPQFQCWCELCWATCEIFSPKAKLSKVSRCKRSQHWDWGCRGLPFQKSWCQASTCMYHWYLILIFTCKIYSVNTSEFSCCRNRFSCQRRPSME